MASGIDHASLQAAVRKDLECAVENFEKLAEQSSDIVRAADMMVEALRNGGKVIFCGNGGSAADAQHLAAELMGRYLRDRKPLPAISLTVDTSALTAIANDYDFADIFSRQLRGLGQKGDVLFGISTSGNSRNVMRAVEAAREMGITTIGLTGAQGGALAQQADFCIRVPATETNRIQEMHIFIGHTICGIVEEAVC